MLKFEEAIDAIEAPDESETVNVDGEMHFSSLDCCFFLSRCFFFFSCLLIAFWFVPFLVAAWSIVDGDRRLFPVLAALACVCAQIHVSYLPLCGGIGLYGGD